MEAIVEVGEPLDPARSLARFHLWGEDPANRLGDGVFRRAVEVDRRWYGYEVRWTGQGGTTRLAVSVPGETRAPIMTAAVAEARHIFGLDLDVAGFCRRAADDPVLSGLVARMPGLRPTLTPL